MSLPVAEERVIRAVDEASEAFWSKVASLFPEVTTGDVEPFTHIEWDGFVHAMVMRWLGNNWPRGSSDREDLEVEAINELGDLAAHEACDYTIKATSPEIALHLAMVLANGGPLDSCGAAS